MQEVSRAAVEAQDSLAFVQYTRACHVLLRDVRAARALSEAITTEMHLRFPDRDPDAAAKDIADRQGMRRFDKLSVHRADAFADQPSLLTGQTFEECLAQHDALLKYVESVWSGACAAFRRAHFPLATFLAIVVIEETAKLGRLWFDLLAYDQPTQNKGVGGKAGRRHKHKHFMTVVQGALINHRLDRVFGKETMKRILAITESGQLEELRQSCIYFSSSDGGVTLPDDVIDRETAKNLCALAGELMAEILGHFPWQFKEMLRTVSDFEVEAGFPRDVVKGGVS